MLYPKRKNIIEYLTKKGKEGDDPKVITMKVYPIQIKPYVTKKPIWKRVVEFMRK